MRRVFLAVCVAAIAAAAATVFMKRELEARTDLQRPVTFDVAPGETFAHVASRLEQSGIVRHAPLLLALARWQGADRLVRHGRHEFSGTLDMRAVLEELARTPKPILRVTIPEGLTFHEVALLLEVAGAASAADYIAAVCAPDLLRSLGVPPGANCSEGYLFPDTYDLTPGMTARQIADLQIRRFHEVAGPLLAALGRDPATAGRLAVLGAVDDPALKPRLITMASIIEKETALPQERPLVAAVMLNRLRLGMPLQVDPTVIYGVVSAGQPWDGNLTRRHLAEPGPYNTYSKPGLPPGPICNPGRASIFAAMAPADVPFLYFVARGDGSHEFNAKLADHNRAVQKFQIR